MSHYEQTNSCIYEIPHVRSRMLTTHIGILFINRIHNQSEAINTSRLKLGLGSSDRHDCRSNVRAGLHRPSRVQICFSVDPCIHSF